MFPEGVIYEGVGDEKPQFFRGESGANDSMSVPSYPSKKENGQLTFVLVYRIPLGDNLLEITASLPQNELTAVLRDFRRYRPRTQREYIDSVEMRARLANVKAFAHADLKSLALYVLNVDQVG
jgi:indoleamine 2,3-dioxygenase